MPEKTGQNWSKRGMFQPLRPFWIWQQGFYRIYIDVISYHLDINVQM